MKKYLIVIQNAGKNYCAYSPDVLGCVATGKTIEETIKNIQGALEFHLEAIIEDDNEIPTPKGLAYYLSKKEPIAEPNDLLTYVDVKINELVLA